MANTIKLGNGNWGVKENGLLAYNNEDNVFKAIEMDFSRSSTATRESSAGLITDSPIDTPRIDFTDDSNGALLLEPERINIVEYSEDGTEWDAINTTVSLTTDSTSPSGQSSVYKVNDDATDAQHRVDVRPSVTSGTEYTLSAFVKKPSDSDIDFVYLIFATNFSTARFYFNIEEGTSLDSGGTIEDYGNGWYRLSASATANSSGNGIFGVNLTDGDGNNTYVGTGNGSMYVWGIQVERNASYPTSYIPTSGSTATRIADAVTGNSSLGQVINSTEGVLYAELEFFNDNSFISISDGSTSNQILIGVPSTLSVIRAVGQSGGSIEYVRTSDINAFKYNKIAFSYKNNEFKFFINGTKINEQLSGNVPLNMTNLQLAQGNNANVFYGKVKDLRVYDVALTDEELQNLTTL